MSISWRRQAYVLGSYFNILPLRFGLCDLAEAYMIVLLISTLWFAMRESKVEVTQNIANPVFGMWD